MKKTNYNDARSLLSKMRKGGYIIGENDKKENKNLSMRDMLKITRRLNEDFNNDSEENTQNMETAFDQKAEEDKFRQFFKDFNVNIIFGDLKVFADAVLWTGVIDGVLMFTFQATPDEATSTVTIDKTPDFSEDNPDNQEIIERIKSYYDIFYKYWRDNVLEQNS
jgi:protein required for attachment to host cells